MGSELESLKIKLKVLEDKPDKISADYLEIEKLKAEIHDIENNSSPYQPPMKPKSHGRRM